MYDFLFKYGLFLAKSLTFFGIIVLLLVVITALLSRRKQKEDGIIEIRDISEKYQDIKNELKSVLLSEQEYKKLLKEEKKAAKKAAKSDVTKKHIFVLDFEGDIQATQVDSLREAISAILTVATSQDEVVVKVDSGGGAVHSYGLAASQLDRLRKKNIPLTVSVDKVAASGGYLMASVANKIIAAPFAIIGSIGVIAELPNFHRLLKKHEIDYEQITAGEYKRTVTMFGENTAAARHKLKDELEQIHHLFKEYLLVHRPLLDLAKVATGEYWLATQARTMGLVDDIMTSDEYLLEQLNIANIYEIDYAYKESLTDKLDKFLHIKKQLSRVGAAVKNFADKVTSLR